MPPLSAEAFRTLAVASLVVAAIVWVAIPRARRLVVATVVAGSGLVAAFVAALLALDVANSGMPSGPPPLVFLAAAAVMGLGGLGIAWFLVRQSGTHGGQT